VFWDKPHGRSQGAYSVAFRLGGKRVKKHFCVKAAEIKEHGVAAARATAYALALQFHALHHNDKTPTDKTARKIAPDTREQVAGLVWDSSSLAWLLTITSPSNQHNVNVVRFKANDASPEAMDRSKQLALKYKEQRRRPNVARHVSGVQNVTWAERQKCWQVSIRHLSVADRTSLGITTSAYWKGFVASPTDLDAVHLAKVAAVEHYQHILQKLGRKVVFSVSADGVELANGVERPSGILGVRWEAESCRWRVAIGEDDQQRYIYIHAIDNTDKNVELARLAAVSERRHWELNRGKDVSSSSC